MVEYDVKKYLGIRMIYTSKAGSPVSAHTGELCQDCPARIQGKCNIFQKRNLRDFIQTKPGDMAEVNNVAVVAQKNEGLMNCN